MKKYDVDANTFKWIYRVKGPYPMTQMTFRRDWCESKKNVSVSIA